jgi:hypothetical protein
MNPARTMFAVAFTGWACLITPIEAQTINLGDLAVSNHWLERTITVPAGGPYGGYELTLDWSNFENAISSEARWELWAGDNPLVISRASPTSETNNWYRHLSWWGGFDTPLTGGTTLTFRCLQQFFALDSKAYWENVQLRFVPTPAAASLMLLATGMLAPRRRA